MSRLAISSSPFVLLSLFVACGPSEPTIVPVDPIILADVVAVTSERKNAIVAEVPDYGGEPWIGATLLRWSLEREIPTIQVFHVRESDEAAVGDVDDSGSDKLNKMRSEAVEPVLELFQKYACVEFEHQAGVPPEAPVQRALILRYDLESVEYDLGSALTRYVVRMELADPENGMVRDDIAYGSPPHSISSKWDELGPALNRADNSAAQGLKDDLANRLLLPKLSERRFPLNDALEAEHRAEEKWRSEQGQP